MRVKDPTTFEEQLQLIKEKGFLIYENQEEECIEFLKQINYYRLSAYFLPFRMQNGSFYPNTNFRRVQKIYEFDSLIRGLIFSIIEDIEISLRTKLAYHTAHKYGALGYLSKCMFSNKHNNRKFHDKINNCIKENRNTLVVKHHNNKYKGQFPIWVIIEFFSVGMLSYYYKDMITEDKKIIANEMKTVPKVLESWLRCLTDLRNRCAHYSRLYYWSFPAMPKMPREINRKADRTLFTQLIVLKYLYPNCERWNSNFILRMKEIINEYDSYISLKHIGFNKGWEEILRHK